MMKRNGRQLGRTLPDYMVHLYYRQDKLPLTPAGKVDRKQLLAPDWTEVESDPGSLVNNQQVMLAGYRCELLKVKSVGAGSQFFAIGGDSIMALQLVGKLRQQGFMLSPKQVFDFPKLQDMAENLEEAQLVIAEQGKLRGEVALLPIQQRYIKHFELSRCNQYIQFKWDYPVDVERLTHAINRLVEHHSVGLQIQSLIICRFFI